MIIHGDGLLALKTLPADSAELVFCDPDWNIGIGMDHAGGYKIGETEQKREKGAPWWETIEFIVTLARGLCVAENALFKFSGRADHMGDIHRCVATLEHPLLADVFIWDKGPGAPSGGNQGVSVDTESLWWFTRKDGRQRRLERATLALGPKPPKGAKKVKRDRVAWPSYSNIIRGHRVNQENHATRHSCEVSPKLCEFVIKFFTVPGDTIIDPCCGSGVLLARAMNFGRKVIGYELDAGHVAAARQVCAGSSARITGQGGLFQETL